MTSTSFTQLIPATARQAHSDLVEALGSETNPAQWMDFMETVTRLLPDVLSVGRPSKDAIQRCAIGQLGFSSWAEMIEAPVAEGGLGWNFSTWKAWRRAWSVVEAQPMFRRCGRTANELNTFAANCKKFGFPLPSTLEEFADQVEKMREAVRKKEAEAQSLEQVREMMESYKLAGEHAAEQLRECRRTIEAQAEKLGELRAKAEARAEILGNLESQVQQLTAERVRLLADNDKLKAALSASKSRAEPKLTRWQHVLAAFRP